MWKIPLYSYQYVDNEHIIIVIKFNRLLHITIYIRKWYEMDEVSCIFLLWLLLYQGIIGKEAFIKVGPCFIPYKVIEK